MIVNKSLILDTFISAVDLYAINCKNINLQYTFYALKSSDETTLNVVILHL